MKKISLIGIVVLGLAFTSCKGVKGEDTVVPFEGFKTTADSLSYFIGSDLTNGLNQNGLGAHLEEGAFLQGMKDAKNGVFLMVIEGEVEVDDYLLSKRDAAGLTAVGAEVKIDIKKQSKLLLLEVPMTA